MRYEVLLRILWGFMKFSIFLSDLCIKLECNSATKLYRKLGGKKNLSVGLRQFQTIFSGQSKPTIDLFISIVKMIDYSLYRQALLAYFASLTSESDDISQFLNYLNVGLRDSIKPPEKQQWSNQSKIRLYTEDQISYLKSNPDALRLHHKILLHDKLLLKNENDLLVSGLIQKDLARIEKDHIISTADAFKIPTEFNSLPRTTRLSSEYIIESMKTFLSFEGGDNQRFVMLTQNISKNDLTLILDESEKFKAWIQSLGQKDHDEINSVPFIYVGFSKGLIKGEIA